MSISRWFVAPLAAGLLVLGTACGGDDNGNAGGETAQSQAAVQVQEGSLNVADLAATLQSIQGFRFDLTINMDFDVPQDGTDQDAAAAAMFLALLGNIQAEGAYVAPDRFEVRAKFFGMDFQTIQIGEQVWSNDGSGWVEGDGGFSTPFELGSPSDLPFEFIPGQELTGAKVSQENVNGVKATRYSFDKDAIVALAESAGEEVGLEDLSEIETMALDIWLDGEGVPVKMQLQVEGESEGASVSINLDFNIKDVNDSGIKIERPI